MSSVSTLSGDVGHPLADMTAAKSPTAWHNGDYPSIDDIKSWIHLSCIRDAAAGGRMRPEVPAAVYAFRIERVGDLYHAYTVHGSRGFFNIYGALDIWSVLQEEWLHRLANSVQTAGVRATISAFPSHMRPLLTRSHADPDIQSALVMLKGPAAIPVVAVHEPALLAPGPVVAPLPPIDATVTGMSKTYVETGHTLVGRPANGSQPPIQAVGISADRMAVYRHSRMPTEEGEPLGSGRTRGLIGQGGTAWVYLIELSMLEIYRAVKVIKIHELCQTPEEIDTMKGRVEVEAKVTAQLQHNNIVQLFQYGEFTGLPYLEMEYVNGFDLKKLLSRTGALPSELAASIALYAAKALEHAHSQVYTIYGKSYRGIMHRDFKPQNLLLSSNGMVKVSDFGLARPVDVSFNTMAHNTVGTLPYMSPEQLETSNVDTRTDVYALGATLYEMLSGKPMFPQQSLVDLMEARRRNTYRPLTDMRRDIPRALTALVDNCVRIDLDKRIRSVQVVVDNLEDTLHKLTRESAEGVIRDYIVEQNIYERSRPAVTGRRENGLLHKLFRL